MKGRWQLTDEPESARWLEKRRVAEVLRRLGLTCLRSDVGVEELGSVIEKLEEVDQVLAAKFGPTFYEALADGRWEADQGHYADRNPLVGLCNAISPPLYLEQDGERTIGKLVFDFRFEGAPGYVHGGLISAVFDQLFGSVMIGSEQPAMTGELSVRYDRPTPLNVELLLEGQIVGQEGKRVFCKGTLSAEGKVLANADCTMVLINNERLQKIFNPAKHSKAGAAEGS